MGTVHRPHRRVSTGWFTLLALRRCELGLRQSDVARRAGITRQHLALLEEGRHTPIGRTARALARALECDVAEIFPNYESSPAVTPSSTKADSDGPDAEA